MKLPPYSRSTQAICPYAYLDSCPLVECCPSITGSSQKLQPWSVTAWPIMMRRPCGNAAHTLSTEAPRNVRSTTLAVKIRLARHGAKKRPYYRIVVADGRMPRDGRYIDLVGRYNPLSDPKTIDIDIEKVDAWVAKGSREIGRASCRERV